MTGSDLNTPESDDRQSQGATTKRESGLATTVPVRDPRQNGFSPLDGSANGAAGPQPGTGLSAYLHALRRHWLLAFGLGLLFAAIGAAGAWFAQTPLYTVVAQLRIAAQERPLVFETKDNASQTQFDVYKGTQQQLIKSRFVLNTALREPSVTQLAIVRDQIDPVRWLEEELQVDFPGKAEIMRLRLQGDDPEGLAAIVNAILDAYLEEVVNVARNQRLERVSTLEEAYTDAENKLRRRRSDLRGLAESLGTGDSEALTLKQQIALEQYASLRREHMRLQFELMRAELDLAAAQSSLDALGDLEISQEELDDYMQRDPLTVALRDEVNKTAAALAAIEKEYTDRAKHRTEPYRQSHDAALSNLKTHVEQLRSRLQRDRRAKLAVPVAQLQRAASLLAQQEQALRADVDGREQEAERIGRSSIDVEMMRAEIQHLDDVASRIATEIEITRVELLQSGARVSPLERAIPPRSPDRTSRLQLTIAAGGAGFLFPLFCITWWDIRSRRINSPADVASGLGLSVIGSVPMIPAIRRFRAPWSRAPSWDTLMNESIDSIGTMLLRKSNIDDVRVIQISSAVGGEGKTTVSTQLSMSLARAGHKTVLVDCDLRRPALHRIFQLEQGPGFCEILRGELTPLEAARPTSSENLWVITVGADVLHALPTLSKGGARTCFDELRASFDFVLIDGSPLLPVAESRLIAQHVDGVVLSILRDVSTAPRILAARRLLDTLSISYLGAVVTGSHGYVYDYATTRAS